MRATTLFKRIGYEIAQKNTALEIWQQAPNLIVFDKINKGFYVSRGGRLPKSIRMEELEAIYQRCKELKFDED